eukprot:Lithocolla_globosa_v1_NODE_762_length_3323_cov_18.216340.p4 type:complete len:173 gc:universal NODE_762_length_3323_cov_18.216340:653-135(-)
MKVGVIVAIVKGVMGMLRGRKLIMRHEYTNRGKRWSAIVAMGVDGLIAGTAHQGTTNADIFYHFVLTDLLPNLVPGRFYVVVLDNASIHYDPRVELLLLQHGIFLRFLSPYSADLNPVEEAFDFSKDWLKRNHGWVSACAEVTDSLEIPLLRSFSDITPSHCRAWFRRSGYY